MVDGTTDSSLGSALAGLSFVLICSWAIIYFVVVIFLGPEDGHRLATSLVSFTALGLTIWWTHHRMVPHASEIGMRRGRLPVAASLASGFAAGAVFSLLVATLLSYDSTEPRGIAWIHFALVPLSLVGVAQVVASPMWEEMLFRGLLLTYLANRWHPWVGVCGQAAVWTLIHLDIAGVDGFKIAGIRLAMALLLGVIARWCRSLYPGMAFHAAYTWMIFLM